MCLKEFCFCWSPPVEGEGSMDRRPQRQPSPKLKPAESLDPPKKTLGVNDSGVQGAATSPPQGGKPNGGHKPYTSPKETPKPYTSPPPKDQTPKPYTSPPPKESTPVVHPSSQMAYHDSSEEEALPKGGVPMNSSANVTGTTEVQQPPTKIEHESIAPTRTTQV
ncbi:putative basic proline-rich protein-like [Iris pallida]|uniref:Basic proline-rich protein-like n=1 Tax=Iris pallida TaxID=29817 RepID=A0AAX6IL35_IRIPA|nr:putative basic proline-rich protein-like [Iris pallida]